MLGKILTPIATFLRCLHEGRAIMQLLYANEPKTNYAAKAEP